MPAEARKFFGGQLNINRKINYIKQKKCGPMAKNLSCLDPGAITLEDGSVFLQFDNKKDGNRLLVFASTSGLQYLADSEEIS